MCMFLKEEYATMAQMLLQSLFTFGECQCDVIIYTSTELAKLITLQSPLIKFEINDSIATLKEACCARLHVFDLESTRKFHKILYLDLDLIIKRPIAPIFDLPIDDKLYALTEGNLKTDEDDDHGKSYFDPGYIDDLDDTSTFTTGILLFRNCDRMIEFFRVCRMDALTRPYHPRHDQPVIIYHAFLLKCFDNKVLCDYAVNNNSDVDSKQILHHFPTTTGNYESKIPMMSDFLRELNESLQAKPS